MEYFIGILAAFFGGAVFYLIKLKGAGLPKYNKDLAQKEQTNIELQEELRLMNERLKKIRENKANDKLTPEEIEEFWNSDGGDDTKKSN